MESGETDTDLLWGAIAGLRRDVSIIVGRLERGLAAAGSDTRTAEEVAEEWRKARQAEIDKLLSERAKVGKGEELDAEDEEALDKEWMNR